MSPEDAAAAPDDGSSLASSNTRKSSSARRADAQLSAHHERLLLRDRALQLKHLPSLGVSERPRTRVGFDALLPPPWTPANRRHEWWLLLLSLLVAVGSFVTLFRLGFTPPGLRSGVSQWELVADMFFCLNVALRLTCVLPPGVADASRTALALSYIRSGNCVRDLLSSFPLDFIFHAAGLRNGDALFVLGLLRLGRLRRLFKLMASYESDLRLPYAHTRGLRFCLYATLQVHFGACAFGFLAQREGGAATWLAVAAELKPAHEVHGPWSRYLMALYWATTTFCGVGYGDVTPANSREYIFVVAFMASTYALSAYVLGNVTVLATMQEHSTRRFREQSADAEAFFRAHEQLLPASLRCSVRAAMQLRQSDARDHREVVELFPPVLRRRCKRLLFLPLIRDCYLFDRTPHTFASVLATMMAVDLFLPGTTILTRNLPVFDVYIITSGAVAFVTPPAADGGDGSLDEHAEDWVGDEDEEREEALAATGEPFDVLSVGDAFGEVAFLFRLVQPFAVKARTLVRTLGLNRDCWKLAQASRPDYVQLVEGVVADRLYLLAEEESALPWSPYPHLAQQVREKLAGAAKLDCFEARRG